MPHNNIQRCRGFKCLNIYFIFYLANNKKIKIHFLTQKLLKFYYSDTVTTALILLPRTISTVTCHAIAQVASKFRHRVSPDYEILLFLPLYRHFIKIFCLVNYATTTTPFI